ncbi:colicin E3/pyocin S6 family cytotoxin [Gordonia sp. PP30]|uniref:colicin E3/pyocin S6 family cytotoxin n=1 Tax=Gordonia sp. PP30 TaxID=2935861 RepID=UPI001FFEFE37|nr:colicin E3/pyocin S6 family cytotoxin [Gordonia sp. PP30]UQE73876.1 colicin E3/pyocin S6 family cytotoxin [Gordonia sp. PP30]
MAQSWPSHKASYVLGILRRELGYTTSARSRSGNQVWLIAAGRPTIRWAYNNKQVITPVELRWIFVEDVGLDEAEALTLVVPRQPGHYQPRRPPDFLDTLEVVPKRTPKRWRGPDGTLYEYDQRHGHVEGFNKRGKHIGVFDVDTGERIGTAERGRSIDV